MTGSTGWRIDKIINIDQSPIGPRRAGNPPPGSRADPAAFRGPGIRARGQANPVNLQRQAAAAGLGDG